MKNQSNRILTTLFIAGAIFLVGCSTGTPPINQNINNGNTINTEMPAGDKTLNSCSTSAIEKRLSKRLKKQLKKKHFDLRYADNTLVISGYVYGGVKILTELLETVDEFRRNDCVKVISFEGVNVNKNFKWCAYEDCRTKSLPSGCKVITTVENSKIKDQIKNKNLSYIPNRGNEGILELKGLVVGKSSSKKFSSLFEEIRKELKGRCLSQIVLKAGEGGIFSKLSYGGFGWQLCQDSKQCECEDGCCVCPCPCNRGDGNTSNSNSP